MADLTDPETFGRWLAQAAKHGVREYRQVSVATDGKTSEIVVSFDTEQKYPAVSAPAPEQSGDLPTAPAADVYDAAVRGEWPEPPNLPGGDGS